MRGMKVGDVMTREVVTAQEDTRFKDLVRFMYDHRVSGVPVVDGEFRLVGIVTEADLLLAEQGEHKHRSAFLEWFLHPTRLTALKREAEDVRAGDIMTRDVVTIRAHESVRDAARILLEAGVKRLPVVDDERRVVGIASRRDLLRPYVRADTEIRKEVVDQVISHTMWIDPTTIKVDVDEGVVGLRGQVEKKSVKEFMVELIRRVDGVVGVEDHLGYGMDDRESRPAVSYGPFGWGRSG
jgi:CBS domain-containing protein